MGDPRMDINSPYFNCVAREEYMALQKKYNELEFTSEITQQSLKNQIDNHQYELTHINTMNDIKCSKEYLKGYRHGITTAVCIMSAIISIGAVIIILT